MHQKKSEVQIGKESSGVSSDFNPTPPLLSPSSIHHKQQQQQQQQTHSNLHFGFLDSFKSSDFTPSLTYPHLTNPPSDGIGKLQILITHNDPIIQSPSSTPTHKTTPHKRPLVSQITPNPSSFSSISIPNSKTLQRYHPLSTTTQPSMKNHCSFNFLIPSAATTSAAAIRFLRRLHHLRRLRVHLRLILLLALPFFYFLVSQPSHSFTLDFLSAFAFSSALLFSLNLAVPRLPSIRLFLSRSFPIKLSSNTKVSRPPLPVFWSIGSKPKLEKRLNSGNWVQAYSNGDVYEGEFHKGKSSGSGIYYYYMSGRYEGEWIDGKYDGYGVETWTRGSRYRGQYRQGLRHGFGVYRFYTGDVYAGEWANGQSHGCGIHTCEDGSRYVGEFKSGVKHGLGHYHFRNGDVYAGEYFADKMHGFGVYRFANGHCYEGAWHEGRRQGLGMYSFLNGETQSGHWNNGLLDVPSTQNTTYPLSPVAVYHSKVLNAIQEARRAAQKAYDVAKVDERVNRAVSIANRTANGSRVAAVKAIQKQMQYDNNKRDLTNP
ncbi:uncharacterized protein LOC124918965 [Impatiens glandulifera]|uniref:uncharacterized protein LOC124918965 n=1 Tax=Impatiens glandulifera TaxID=253017 RepID=UPI001FB092C3|nr:uncharacterized protein LOC124918965 [Impatiens glandulifera]